MELRRTKLGKDVEGRVKLSVDFYVPVVGIEGWISKEIVAALNEI